MSMFIVAAPPGRSTLFLFFYLSKINLSSREHRTEFVAACASLVTLDSNIIIAYCSQEDRKIVVDIEKQCIAILPKLVPILESFLKQCGSPLLLS